jgi:hypothetical protein
MLKNGNALYEIIPGGALGEIKNKNKILKYLLNGIGMRGSTLFARGSTAKNTTSRSKMSRTTSKFGTGSMPKDATTILVSLF